jgi:hypothetical protein
MPALRIHLWTKIGLAALLVAIGDQVIHAGWSGASAGLLAIGALAVVITSHPAAVRLRLGRFALALAGAFAILPLERPSLLGWAFLWTALALAVLSPRARRGDDALAWAKRLAVAALRALPAPVQDLRLATRARRRTAGDRTITLRSIFGLVALPLAGGAVFALLFAAANPVIAQLISELRLPSPDFVRIALWTALAWWAWLFLRPRGLPKWARGARPRPLAADRMFTARSVVLSLALFNLLFGLQNALDIAYLWGGAALPDGMTFAEYAHRGAYPLIATALLAGAFVLVFLAPGSEVAALRPARVLVTLWVGQNVFLVFSTALRTLDYIDAYSLTRLRIAALAWMALVAVGLGLIAWRLLRAKSSSWLNNANAAAAALTLAVCACLDLGSIAAAWNVRHARELGTSTTSLDLCYLSELGPSALVSLSELQPGALPPMFQARVANVRSTIMHDLIAQQSDWRRWTWRGQRRLDQAYRLGGAPSTPITSQCDGTPIDPPLTPGSRAGT